MKFSDFITEAKIQKLQPETPEELRGMKKDEVQNVDLKYIESKIDWDNTEGSDFEAGTPQEQGRYNDTVISGTLYYGKGTPWELSFTLRGDAKVSRGWNSNAKFKRLPSPEYTELGGLTWRESAFIECDAFRKMFLKHAKKTLKEMGWF